MNLVNKKVVHKTFGKGNVVNYDDSYINISFKSGDKRFSFPSAFKKYIKFTDQNATDIINEKIKIEEELLKIEEEKQRKEQLILEEQRAIERKRQYMLDQQKQSKSGKSHAEIQSVFWPEPHEEEEIFTEWKVFIGEIKSGKNKGKPRKLARMNSNSGCLITKRTDFMEESHRQILGVFMTNEFFNGRLCEDGYIMAHPQYRLKLTEEESKDMLFWNYYMDKNSSTETIWNSGRQRYFDNIWMAQILRDIVILREDSESHKEAEAFFEYFCKINLINKDDLPIANGPLMNI